jgi:transposase
MGKSITDLSSVTTVGLDLAKHVFQVHGVDASGRVIVAKALRRKDVLALFAQLPECLVGMEACTSAHHWARELVNLGHDPRMMPPAYVKPYGAPRRRDHLWRKIPPRELSIDLEADERLGRAIGRAGAS